MKSLRAVTWLAAIVSSVQASSYSCRWVGYCSTPDRVWGGAVASSYAYVVDDTFGLRIADAVELQSPRNFDAQNTAWRGHAPGAGDYAAEAGGALVGGILVGAGVGLVLAAPFAATERPADDPFDLTGSRLAALGGFVLGYPAGCAMGAATVGSWLQCEGNTRGAYSGAYVGMLCGVFPFGVPVLLFAPAGAVIGYNLGGGDGYASSFGTRVSPPAVAFGLRSDRGRQRNLGFDCRLVTVRF